MIGRGNEDLGSAPYKINKGYDLHDPDNHNGVITHLEPDILEFEVGLRKHL